MIILLAALATIGNAEPTPKLAHKARASITIVRGREISSRTWKPILQPAQREIIIKEKDGRPSLIRLTEFE